MSKEAFEEACDENASLIAEKERLTREVEGLQAQVSELIDTTRDADELDQTLHDLTVERDNLTARIQFAVSQARYAEELRIMVGLVKDHGAVIDIDGVRIARIED